MEDLSTGMRRGGEERERDKQNSILSERRKSARKTNKQRNVRKMKATESMTDGHNGSVKDRQ